MSHKSRRNGNKLLMLKSMSLVLSITKQDNISDNYIS
jgi:hypothetical protein